MREIRKFAEREWEWANVDAALDAEMRRREAAIREELLIEQTQQRRQAEFKKNRAEAEAKELIELRRSTQVDDIDMLF